MPGPRLPENEVCVLNGPAGRDSILRPSIIFGTDDGFFNRFGSHGALCVPALPLFGGGKYAFPAGFCR